MMKLSSKKTISYFIIISFFLSFGYFIATKNAYAVDVPKTGDPIIDGIVGGVLGGLGIGGGPQEVKEVGDAGDNLKIIREKAEATAKKELNDKATEPTSLGGVVVNAIKKRIPCVSGFNDKCAWFFAKQAAQQISKSLVNWSRNGFRGNPTFVTDPDKFFGELADNVAGDFISGSELSFLCSPFQNKVRRALQINFELVKSSGYLSRSQCTFTEVVGNVEKFIEGDFSQGGWDGWFKLTQNRSNNPYGALLDAQSELDNRISGVVTVQNKKLDWGKGFLSWSDCAVRYADTPGIAAQYDPITGITIPAVAGKLGGCKKEGPIKTPGTIIETQLNETLGTGQRSFEIADEMDEVLGVAISGLIGKLFDSTSIFSGGGLLGGEAGGSGEPVSAPGGGNIPTTSLPTSLSIYLFEPNPIQMEVNGVFNDPGYAAYDPNDPDIEEKVIITGFVDPGTPGTYSIFYSVTNSLGQSTSATRTVIVSSPSEETGWGNTIPENSGGGSGPGDGQQEFQ